MCEYALILKMFQQYIPTYILTTLSLGVIDSRNFTAEFSSFKSGKSNVLQNIFMFLTAELRGRGEQIFKSSETFLIAVH